MQLQGKINKSVDKERTLFGLKGIFIVLFISGFMGNILLYMILSSFFSPLLILMIILISICITIVTLVRLNKKYGIHIFDRLTAQYSTPKYLSRTSITLNIS